LIDFTLHGKSLAVDGFTRIPDWVVDFRSLAAR